MHVDARAWLFGKSPQGNPSLGDEASLGRLTDPDRLVQRWRDLAAPRNRWIAVTGDFDEAAVGAALGGAGESAPADPPRIAPATLRTGGVLLVDDPRAAQAYVRAGGGLFSRDDPAYAARYLANTILGGRFTSRLNQALRVRSGLAYEADSYFDDERGGVLAIVTSTLAARAGEAIPLLRSTYDAFVEKGITADELPPRHARTSRGSSPRRRSRRARSRRRGSWTSRSRASRATSWTASSPVSTRSRLPRRTT